MESSGLQTGIIHDDDADIPARSFWYVHAKRGLDLLGAGLLLVCCAPLLALIAGMVWWSEGRPVLYRQLRAGRDGVPFTLWKFRTMRQGTPPRLPDRPVAKRPDDPRVTRFGKLLRRTGLDELPQLWNVLRGEMSLVGPRPLPIEDLHQSGWLFRVDAGERQRRLDWLARRQQVLPGLTGFWQISPNAEDDFENWMTCDLAYIRTRSLRHDLRIVLLTPWALLRGRQQK